MSTTDPRFAAEYKARLLSILTDTDSSGSMVLDLSKEFSVFDEDLPLVFDFLKKHPNIIAVNMQRNGLNEGGMQQLSDFLRNNTNIMAIDLGFAYETPREPLLECLMHNRSLVLVHFPGPPDSFTLPANFRDRASPNFVWSYSESSGQDLNAIFRRNTEEVKRLRAAMTQPDNLSRTDCQQIQERLPAIIFDDSWTDMTTARRVIRRVIDAAKEKYDITITPPGYLQHLPNDFRDKMIKFRDIFPITTGVDPNEVGRRGNRVTLGVA